MSLRRQSLSPTANLLRNSRLFSLPNPLPRPLVTEPFGAGGVKASDSATLPYPTHQAIATTPKSLARGDWGLKRPLPSRSRLLQVSNPVVRIKQWDTIEHITDFDSAADHVRTRQKFEELHTPVLKGMSHFSEKDLTAAPPKSAFERGADVTSYDVEEGLDGAGMALKALKESFAKMQKKKKGRNTLGNDEYTPPVVPVHSRLQSLRWKHDGPWLPGMSAVDFTNYLTKELASRRAEFNDYLIHHVKTRIYAQRSNPSNATEPPPLDEADAALFLKEQQRTWKNFTAADIASGIQTLRTKCAADPLTSDLVQKLIVPFLRLPPMTLKATSYAANSANIIDNQRFSDETTPNSTHPSAGLGYLRSKAYLPNHPLLGPQALPAPAPARVIQPRKLAAGSEFTAKLGVAGFVADDEFRNAAAGGRHFSSAGRDVEALDVETPGGAKIAVQTAFAAVSPDGRVHIKVKRSYGPELAVSRGALEDRPPVRESVDARAVESLDLGRSGVSELDRIREERQRSSAFFDLLRRSEGREATRAPVARREGGLVRRV